MKVSKIFQLLIIVLLALNACSDDDSESPTPNSNGGTNSSVSLPSTVSGQVVNMIFTAPQTGAPYTLDQEVTFTFSSSGMLFLDTNPSANDGDEVSISSVSKEGNEFVWTDANQSLSYKLSLKSDSSINEVNVYSTSDNSFLGQFVPTNTSGSDIALVTEFAGSYAVSAVNNGTHSRMTVDIDANGNIDFDSNIQLNASDFNSISDKKTCCNAIYIDMNPYPTEPYPRVNLILNATNDAIEELEYYPSYPNVSGKTVVALTPSSGGTTGQLTVGGDFSKVGGATYDPPAGIECTSCTNDKFTWTKPESTADRVLSIEIFSNQSVIVDFSAGSAFRASGSLSALGIVHDTSAKTFTFTNVTMGERFSQPGMITLNGTLSYN